MFFVAVAILICVFSFIEIIIFNEEVLLALCFIAFIFFIYSISNKSMIDDFNLQIQKLITDLLQAIKNKLDHGFQMYLSCNNVMQFNNQMDSLYELFITVSNFSYVLHFKVLTDQITSVFLQSLSTQLRFAKIKEKNMHSFIIEQFIFIALFEKSLTVNVSSHLFESYSLFEAHGFVMFDNYTSFIEIHAMD
jgi:hypothetical protein